MLSEEKDDGGSSGGVSINPLLSRAGSGNVPSSAFMESWKRSRATAELSLNEGEDEGGFQDRGSINWRTALTIIFFLVVGSTLFISGAVVFWSGSGKNGNSGLDLLLCSLIMLLPGLYAGTAWYGAFRRWPGYTMALFAHD